MSGDRLGKRREVVHMLKQGQDMTELDVWPGDRIITPWGESYRMTSTGDYVRCTDDYQKQSA